MKIGQLVVDYKKAHPTASAHEILAHVQKKVPGCVTSLASVSSTLSRAGLATGRTKNVPHFATSTTNPKDMEAHDPEESVEEARRRINVRYDAMQRLAKRLVSGAIPSLIVSGPPGMSKSWTMTECLRESGRMRHDGLENVGGGGPFVEEGRIVHPGWYDHIGGSATAVGLYHALWNMRKGGLLFLDDCDAVFRDEDALNLLKVATDSTRERLCSWRKNANWLAEFEIDKTFDFQGHIAFLTNIDFEDVITKGHRDAEHFKALIDRALYLCLTLRSTRDFMIRIKDVADGEQGMLAKYYGLNKAERGEVLGYVEEHKERFYNLSLRLVGTAAVCMKADPRGWKADIEATKMRTRA